MKKFLKTAAAAAFLAGTAAGVSANELQQAQVAVNGAYIDTQAVIDNDRVLVPLRGVYERLGFDISWDSEAKTAEFVNESLRMSVTAGSRDIIINGKRIISDVPAKIINDRFYLPLRAASEGFGLEVNWDVETKTAYVIGEAHEVEIDELDISAVKYANGFAYKLNELMPTDSNYMFSPLSIKMALSLAANGADGETLEEIKDAVGIDDIDTYNSYVRQLIEVYGNNDDVQLSIANSLWLNKDKSPDVSFASAYTEQMERFYNAEVDYVNNSDAVEKVNSWCRENTNGKIPSIIDKPDFLAVLANAIYFKGDWDNTFEKSATRKSDFTGRNGNTTSIDFMNNTKKFRYYEDKNLKIVELPYKGGDTVMYVVLSNDKRVDVTPYLDKLSYEKVHVSMPKFKTEYSTKLNDALNSLGIKKAFSQDSAEFGKMFESEAEEIFYIDSVLHKTYIEVDETGTEAAAVTAIVEKTTSAYEPREIIREFIADKPFTYIIADKNTDEILFMGEYAYAE